MLSMHHGSDGSGTLSIEEFKQNIPDLSANPLVERVISIFDADGDGEIDFEEFIKGISMFSVKGGSHDNKLMCESASLLLGHCQASHHSTAAVEICMLSLVKRLQAPLLVGRCYAPHQPRCCRRQLARLAVGAIWPLRVSIAL
jgi:hypothetical protein